MKDNSGSSSSSNSSSSGQDPAADDKWGNVLSVNHTLASLYLQKLEVRTLGHQSNHLLALSKHTQENPSGYHHRPGCSFTTLCAVQIEPFKQRDWEARRTAG